MNDEFHTLPDGSTLHTPPNKLLRIDQVWVFVSLDEDGNEGVCAASLPGLGVVPLIAADEDRLKSLTGLAHEVSQLSGKTIRLIRLCTREEVMVIEPGPKP